MTLLEVLNKVLRRLREDEVMVSTNTAYTQLVADFISDIYDEAQEDHDWSGLTHDLEFDTVASQRIYDLGNTIANGGDAANSNARVTSLDSEITTNEYGGPNAYIFVDGTDDEGSPLTIIDDATMYGKFNTDRSNDSDPCWMSVRQNSQGNGLEVQLYPVPDAARKIRIQFFTPADTLLSDGTDDATTILIPPRPVFLGALYLALNERGEEIGEPGGIAESRYRAALGAAIETDMKIRTMTNRYEAYRD